MTYIQSNTIQSDTMVIQKIECCESYGRCVRYVCNGSQRKRRMSAIQSAKATKAAKAVKQKKLLKVKKMTTQQPLSPLPLPKYNIDISLITEVLFSNEEAFNSVDTQTAMMIRCVCKNARLNKGLQRKRDVYKADEFSNKLTDIIGSFIMSKRVYLSCNRYDTCGKDTPVISSNVLEKLAIEVVKENEDVKDGFRELVVLRYKNSKYNYNRAKIYKAGFCDYCVQYRKAIKYFGYYDYYKGHTSDNKHFMALED